LFAAQQQRLRLFVQSQDLRENLLGRHVGMRLGEIDAGSGYLPNRIIARVGVSDPGSESLDIMHVVGTDGRAVGTEQWTTSLLRLSGHLVPSALQGFAGVEYLVATVREIPRRPTLTKLDAVDEITADVD
jgi:hypothetical protein